MRTQDIRKDIEQMRRLLEKHWGKNVHAVNSLSSFPTPKRNEDIWEYRYDNLIFKNIDLGQSVYPNERFYNARIKLSILVGGKTNYIPMEDPFNKLDFNITIFADYNSLSYTTKTLQASWHLDKNVGNNEETTFFHPEYHIHFGGRDMIKPQGRHYGDLLLLSSPRLAHLPLDLILAIDFIIKNFYEKNKHNKLTNLTEYKKLITEAQNRFWQPYIVGLASHWYDLDKIEKINPSKLLPNIYNKNEF